MLVCPIDYRYGRDEVKRIFSEEGTLQYMVEVEIALLGALESVGRTPAGCSKKARDNVKKISSDRVREIEAEIKHDVMAVVRAMAEVSGDCGKYIHLGATSNDIIDTATALKFRDFYKILMDDFYAIEDTLADLAYGYRGTVMLGRTHGQAAVPITFGLKMANYLAEILRHHQRFKEIQPRILVGKMLGAVGTGAALGPDALSIQEMVMRTLNLGVEESPTQIIARDRYVEFVSAIAALATTFEKIATEIRNLQRTEINEVQEGFNVEKQVGSSTMAQKKNPITSENVCGLARIIRGFLVPTHESAVLWHERDLTNSSAERFILSHVCVLIDDIMNKMDNVLKNLVVNKDIMLKNLQEREEVLAERIIVYLVDEHGWSRQDAHEKIRQIAMRPGTFRENLLNDSEIGRIIRESIDNLLDPKTYIGVSEKLIEKILDKKEKI